MKNWEEELEKQCPVLERLLQFLYGAEFTDYKSGKKIKEEINNLILQTRQDTLRQVLPKQMGQSTTSYGFGVDDMIEEIKTKAKEIWGIDLSKD